jgi:hypothetical protein
MINSWLFSDYQEFIDIDIKLRERSVSAGITIPCGSRDIETMNPMWMHNETFGVPFKYV